MNLGEFAVFTIAFFAAIAGLIWLLTYLEQTLESSPQNLHGSTTAVLERRMKKDVASVQGIRGGVPVGRGREG
jgi:hypothetical protein